MRNCGKIHLMKRSIKIFYFILLLLLLPFFNLQAEEFGRAVLVKGPLPHNGIEYIGVNQIPSQYGEYDYNGERISVYFTREDIFLSENWINSDCSLSGIHRLNTESEFSVFVYVDERGWAAFFAFPGSFDNVCEFIGKYRSRQNYFINISRDENEFSFPAFLE